MAGSASHELRLRYSVAMLAGGGGAHRPLEACHSRQMLLFDRIIGRQADAQKALLSCVFDNMPEGMRTLLF